MLQGGIYSKSMNYTVEKTAQEMAYLLWFHEKAKGGDRWLFNSTTDNFFCGHVRAATKGTINADNAHPFDLDDIVGMHNGTLKEVDYRPGFKETDSEMMFKDIEKNGMQPVLSKLHKDSAYAIVMLDKKKKEIAFTRNEHRPLHCTWNLNRKVFYWASEAEMLEWILNRNGIKRNNICSFAPGLIHRISPLEINSNKPHWRIEEVHPKFPEVKEDFSKAFTDYDLKNIPALAKKPVLRVVENKPSPLPEQQKAKEKDQKGTKVGKEKSERAVYPRAKLHTICCGCRKDMDVLDKYQGHELSAGQFLCKSCDLEFENMNDLKRVKFLQ